MNHIILYAEDFDTDVWEEYCKVAEVPSSSEAITIYFDPSKVEAESEEDEDDDDDYYDSTYDNEEVALLKRIAQSLDMPYEADEDDYDEWNYLSLLHDYNNGRGGEWVDTFEEQGLDSELLDQYKKLVDYDEEEDD